MRFSLYARILFMWDPLLRSCSLSCLLLASLLVPSLQNEAREPLNRGSSHLQRRETDQAIKELREAVALDPQSAAAHMLLGQAYLQQGSLEMLAEAKAELVQALAIDPTLIWARFYLAKIYLDLGRTHQAKEELESGLKTRPNVPHFLALLGEVNRKLGNLELSIQQNKKALEVDPSMNAAHYHLGLTYLDLKREDEAIHELAMALDSKYLVPEMYIALGSIHLERGNLDQAAGLFEKTIALDPSRSEGHLKLGQAYRQKKLFDQALAELTRAVPEGKRFLSTPYFQQLQADTYYEMGLVHEQKEAMARAAEAYAKVLDIAPDHGKAHRQLAEVLFLQNEFDRSLQHALKAEQLGFPVEKSLFEKIVRKGKTEKEIRR